MTQPKGKTMSERELRRKIAAAKSYLSRLDNQWREALRSSNDLNLCNQLVQKRHEQYEKFHALCRKQYD